MSYYWKPGAIAGTWSKDKGIFKKEVVGVALRRLDGDFYLMRSNKIRSDFGFAYSTGKQYEWGLFIPPVLNEHGLPGFEGQFTHTSTAQEGNWNKYHQSGIIDETKGRFTNGGTVVVGDGVFIDPSTYEAPIKQEPETETPAAKIASRAILIALVIASIYITVRIFKTVIQ